MVAACRFTISLPSKHVKYKGMPIEIRELHIKVKVEDTKKSTPTITGPKLESLKKEIITESVEECLRILAREKER